MAPGLVATPLVVPPIWFSVVMGTSMVALLVADAAPTVALSVWVVAAVAGGLVLVGIRIDGRWYGGHPVLAHGYGAASMAAMSLGAAGLATQGPHGTPLLLHAVLWTLGTALGLATALGTTWSTRRTPLTQVGPWWLLAVVPPTVSATTGAPLVQALPDGGMRTALLACCYMFLVTSLALTARVLALLAARVRRHGWGEPAVMVSWLIVLGPLGQSITALDHLADVGGSRALAQAYGPPVLALALLWLAVAAGLVLRARPRFNLGWWALTFPVGTVATGAASMGADTLAGVLTAGVVAAWLVVAPRTVAGVLDGSLLR
ncbi:hypothetical protein [Nocardioides sp. R-C-SC26]|uniref:SLAC1 family transporter n=1 Tax=Nocardioides sp. R-C-SC26 TaxID=2870414 RepID=UPI001E583E43|nr:hypothetical protein [Nocardioides sp. R-C-SC26]